MLVSGPGVMAQPAVATFVVLQVSVDVSPLAIVDGLALKLVMIGAGISADSTLTLTDLVAWSPFALLHARV